MRLCVGLLGASDGWQLLLEQEGVPFAVVAGDPSPDEFSSLIVGKSIADVELHLVQNFLRAGGGVLCSAQMFERIGGCQTERSAVRFILPEENSLFGDIGIVDVFSQCNLPRGGNTLRTHDGKTAAFIGDHDGGYVVVLPFDAGELILDRRTATKSFYAETGRLPFEHVSLVSKNGVRKLVNRSLELLHHRRGLPYAHLWYYPRDAQSVFSFRIDTDYGTRAEIESLYNLASKLSIPMTWFVDVKSQESFLSMFKQMAEQEIGLHCFDHQVFDEYDRNRENIRKAQQILERHDLHPVGFAAPFGQWNEGLARAIEDAGFEYSSEFSYDYDNLPSTPVIDGKRRKTLQVPVHPISIGSLRRQGFRPEDMKNYFERVIDWKMAAREPLMFYHHPKDNHHDVLEYLFELIKRQNTPMLRMGEYAAWWTKRALMNHEIEFQTSTLKSKASGAPENVLLHLTRGDGSEAFVPCNAHTNVDALTWLRRPCPPELPSDITRVRKFNPWIPLIRFQDRISSMFRSI